EQLIARNPPAAYVVPGESSRQQGANHGMLREALLSLGAAYTDKGDYKNAAICYQQMFTSSIRSNAVVDACRALNNLGNTSMYQGDYARSAQYYFYAAQLAKRSADT